MRPIVSATFPSWSAKFEGSTDWLYCDVLGLVTIGIGLLVDPEPCLSGLTFAHPDGSAASDEDVHEAWRMVKARQDLRLHGGGAYAPVTRIRATKGSLDAMLVAKLSQMERGASKAFPEWDQWPAKAQLAAASMMWAAGPGIFAKFPHFSACARAQDWAGCAANCHIEDSQNPGLRPRNAANVALFLAAAEGGDPDSL